MKYILSFLVGILFFPFLSGQEYILDVKKSNASWTGYGEIGSFKQEGTIGLKNGVVFLKDNQIHTGSIVFDVKSIDHENKDLKKHLKAEDFFHAKRYPEIRFDIAEVEGNRVKGFLIVRGIKKEEEFEFETITKDDFIIFSGKAIVDRTKYDIKYNSSSYFQDLGNYAIKNEFEVDFRLYFVRKQ